MRIKAMASTLIAMAPNLIVMVSTLFDYCESSAVGVWWASLTITASNVRRCQQSSDPCCHAGPAAIMVIQK